MIWAHLARSRQASTKSMHAVPHASEKSWLSASETSMPDSVGDQGYAIRPDGDWSPVNGHHCPNPTTSPGGGLPALPTDLTSQTYSSVGASRHEATAAVQSCGSATFAPGRILASNLFESREQRGGLFGGAHREAAPGIRCTIPKWLPPCISRDSGCSSRAGPSLCDANLH
jgi:hypothetical protein